VHSHPRSRHALLRLALTFVAALVATVLSLGSLTDVRAATGTLVVGNMGADGEISSGFYTWNGGAWTIDGVCGTGSYSLPGIVQYRFALEFPLAALPADATITSASLTLRTGSNSTGQTGIYGYAGDGSMAEADATVGGTPVLFTATPAVSESHDVTSFLTPAALASGWAGFSVRQDPLLATGIPFTTWGDWGCTNATVYPFLTIEYSVPDPAPVATPTPTPSPTPSPGSPTVTAPTVIASPTPLPLSAALPAQAALPNTALSGGSSARSLLLGVALLASVAVYGLRRLPMHRR
jgi:hypothetical protein